MKYGKSLSAIGIVAALGALLWYGQEISRQERASTESGIFLGDGVEAGSDTPAPPVSRKNDPDSSQSAVSVPIARNATVYKAPNCGCCNGYIAELEKRGFAVEVKSTRDMGSIKERYGILDDKQSCHTTEIGGYFVEGHVPLVAVEKLLSEKPDIDGIGLPGMPIGTPGMPGVKQAPYEIYQKKRSDFSQFMTL